MNHQNIKKQRKPKEEPSPKKSQKETGKEEETQKKKKNQENLQGNVFHKLWAKMVACKNWTTSSPNNGFVFTTSY